MGKISAVYQIVNTVTNDRYVGSSNDVMRRWSQHKRSSIWKRVPNSPLYRDMQKYGIENFRFQILSPVEPEYLKRVEQEFIDVLKPTYNAINAKGLDVERMKELTRKAVRKYSQTENRKEAHRKYAHKLCRYNGEMLTLDALRHRFRRDGVEHPTIEAKKYLIRKER